jgi:hypothetical protein
VFNAAFDMRDENRLGFLPVPNQRAFKQLLVLARGDLTAEHHGDHLVSKIPVIGQGMGRQQHFRSTGRYQRVVKIPITLFP